MSTPEATNGHVKRRELADPFPRTIVVERREVIAEIVESPDGVLPMLRVAFEAASDYVTRHADNGESVDVTFTFGNDVFHVGVEPIAST